jgi:hypothetical protein
MLKTFAAAQRQRLSNKDLDASKVAGTLDEAVWTLVARAVMNLDEFVVKR